MSCIGARHITEIGYNPREKYTQYNKAIRGLKNEEKSCRRKTKRKRALTVDMLNKATTLKPAKTVRQKAMYTAIRLAICFLLRVCELVKVKRSNHHLRANDVSISYKHGAPHMLSITIPSSKASAEPKTLHLSATYNPTCIVALTADYLEKAKLKPTGPLFPGLTPRRIAKEISNMAVILGFDPLDFGTHSLRRGGTTTLASEGMINEYIIRHFGRWSSKMWEQVYQELTLESITLISKKLSSGTSSTSHGHKRNR